MAYVQPSGIIQLFKGINLDNRYMHTIYFANESAQNTWFSNKYITGATSSPATAFQFEAQSYSRPTKNSVKVQIAPDSVLGVTYMRFKNRAKWFYAFVLATEYINENTTLITYEIDVMQTWFISEGNLLPCYVERQHATNDTFGLNLEAEPVGSDAYDFTEIEVPNVENDFSTYMVIINSSSEPEETNMVVDGIVTGTYHDYIPVSTATPPNMGALKNKMHEVLGDWNKQEQSADIIDLYMFPYNFTVGASGVYHTTTYNVKHSGKLSNYIPKNNKLFTYPYSSLYVTTNDGDNAVYRWEYFEGDITTSPSGADFDVNATVTGGGCIEMHPHSYNGVEENYDSKIVMNNFPKCSWAFDAYQAWIANGGQYKTQYALDMMQKKGALAIVKETLSGATSLVNIGESAQANSSRKNPAPYSKYGIGAVTSAVQSAMDIESTALSYEEARSKIQFEFKDARYEPNIVIGQQTPNIAVGYKYLGFRFFNLHVRDDEAKRIDDFFSVYGYAVNKVVVPNLTHRQYWNFIKTKECQIGGNMPASSKAAIARIFDGGIFFWHNGDQVGNFRQSVTNDTINNPIV